MEISFVCPSVTVIIVVFVSPTLDGPISAVLLVCDCFGDHRFRQEEFAKSPRTEIHSRPTGPASARQYPFVQRGPQRYLSASLICHRIGVTVNEIFTTNPQSS